MSGLYKVQDVQPPMGEQASMSSHREPTFSQHLLEVAKAKAKSISFEEFTYAFDIAGKPIECVVEAHNVIEYALRELIDEHSVNSPSNQYNFETGEHSFSTVGLQFRSLIDYIHNHVEDFTPRNRKNRDNFKLGTNPRRTLRVLRAMNEDRNSLVHHYDIDPEVWMDEREKQALATRYLINLAEVWQIFVGNAYHHGWIKRARAGRESGMAMMSLA